MKRNAAVGVCGECMVKLNQTLAKVDSMSGETGLDDNHLDRIGVSDVVCKILSGERQIEILSPIGETGRNSSWFWSSQIVVPRVKPFGAILGRENGGRIIVWVGIAAGNEDRAVWE